MQIIYLPMNIHPVSFYFEKAPLSLISILATENGIIQPNKIAEKMRLFSVSDWLFDSLNEQ